MRWELLFALVVALVVCADARRHKKVRCKADDNCVGSDGAPGCCILKTWTNKKGVTKSKGKCSRRPFSLSEFKKCKADCECREGLKCVKEDGMRKGRCQDPSVQSDDPAIGEEGGPRRSGGRRGRGRGRRPGGARRGGRRGGKRGRGRGRWRGGRTNFTTCSDESPCPEGFCCVKMPSRNRRAGDRLCLPTKFEIPNKKCLDSCQCDTANGYFCFSKNAANPRRGNKGRCLTEKMASGLDAPNGKWLGQGPATVADKMK